LAVRGYTNIQVWKLADDRAVAIYQATKTFPREEIYGLTSQLRRASYSVPANIAEGSARGSKKEYLHFLYISRGSLSEAQYFVHLSQRLGYLSDTDAERLSGQTRQTFACLHGLISAVEKEAGAAESVVP
jgi:four helix bundle protein